MSDQHFISFKTYLRVLIALVFLTVLTVAFAQVDFGSLNAYIALFIASFKGILVLLYFMHLRYDDLTHAVIFGSSVFFLLLLFFISKIDVATRVIEVNTL